MTTDQIRGVRFHHASAPYEAMDVAGFPAAKAQDLVDRGIATFWPRVEEPPGPAPDVPVDILTDMDRGALVAFAAKHLGTADEPPVDVTDDALRAAIRAAVNPKLLKAK